MNGLPPGIDLTSIVGRQLDVVSFARWTVVFVFDDRAVRIAVEGTIRISGQSLKPCEIDDYRANATSLCQFIGATIEAAVRTANGGMELGMSSGDRITFENSKTGYESFQLHIGETVFVA